jgi:hypothetical protein
MKRFHVHLHVSNLSQSIAFYSQLFAAAPSRTETDYAKWMLDDPPVNFAISTRGDAAGIDHLGIQTDDEQELAELKQRAQSADMALLDEGATTCCYARSEKHWVTDPQGIAWEHFHTLGNIPVFREKQDEPVAGVCCTPTVSAKSEATSCCEVSPAAQASNCCPPANAASISAHRCC